MTGCGIFSETNDVIGRHLSIGSGVTWNVNGLTVTGGFTNEGIATIGPSETVDVEAGADFRNSGTLAMGEGARIQGPCTGDGGNTSGDIHSTGTVVVDPGASQKAYLEGSGCWVAFFDKGAIELNSGTVDYAGITQGLVLQSGASVAGPGHWN
jgi:hypothetical protein